MINKFLTRLTVALSRYHGLYFFLKNWERASDFKSIQNLLNTGVFESTQVMKPLPLIDYKKILIIAPHQDDESIGCGGLIQQLIDMNRSFDLYYSTEGEQHQTSAEHRFMELDKALNGADYRVYRSGISNLNPRFNSEHISELSEIIDTGAYDIVFVPWIFDTPDKHRLAHYMFTKALSKAKSKPYIAQYQVHSSLIPNYFLDITGVIDRKKMMIEAFESQLVNVEDYVHTTMGLNMWNSKQVPHRFKSRYAELYFVVPGELFLKINRRVYNSLLESLVPNLKEIEC